MQISDLTIGQTARIQALASSEDAYRNQLITMGFLPGTLLTLVRIAPLGDPVEVLIRGTSLVLRKAEAAIVQLEALPPC